MLVGGPGDDIFQINTGNGRAKIKDFTAGDQIQLLTGTGAVDLTTWRNHVKVEYQGDLMAIIQNVSTGDLDQNGAYIDLI